MTLLIVMPSFSFARTGSAQTSPVNVGPRSSVCLPAARESRIIVIGMMGKCSEDEMGIDLNRLFSCRVRRCEKVSVGVLRRSFYVFYMRI